MIKIAIVGIRGIPNNYGGFETLAEYLTEYLADNLQITVYCSSTDMPIRLKQYKGAQLSYIPVSSHGFLGIIYDTICLVKAIKKNDKVLILGFGTGFVVPFIASVARHKLIVNIGGLDWKRNKWSWIAKKVIKKAEALLIKNCRTIIADNIGIQNYIFSTYGKVSRLIAYGGDQAKHITVSSEAVNKYTFLSNPYCFSVARIQPDNNIYFILHAFTQIIELPLVFVGNWDNSDFGKKLKQEYTHYKNLIILDAIYDRNELDLLRSNCTIYIHGHSAGGTNPSLVEAMNLGLPVMAFDSVYNRFTTENKALYFEDEKQLVNLIHNYQSVDLFSIANELKQIALANYTWEKITEQYRQVFCSSI